MTRPLRQIIRGRSAAVIAGILLVVNPVTAEDLRTISGRVYKNAILLRAEADGLVIKHKFGVVKISFTDLSAEARKEFNAAKALEAARQARARQQELAAERERERAERIQEQKAMAQRAAVDVDERNQEEAEVLEARIQRGQTGPSKEHRTAQRYRLRGEVIGIGSGWVLVLCEPEGGVSRVKEELARLRDSPFSPPTPAVKEVLVVTGLRRSLAEGETVDLPVEAAGTKSDFRTRSGDIYSGRYRVFRALE